MPRDGCVRQRRLRRRDFEATEPGTAGRWLKFASKNLWRLGRVSGEREALGKDALVEVPYGNGRVVLFAFRPQFFGGRRTGRTSC